MTSRLAVARRIASQQHEIGEGLEAVYLVKTGPAPHNTRQPIVLLQVNREAVAVGVMPLGFPADPDNGIPFPYVIIDVTPGEFGSLREARTTGRPVRGWRDEWEVGQMLKPLART